MSQLLLKFLCSRANTYFQILVIFASNNLSNHKNCRTSYFSVDSNIVKNVITL